MSLKLSPRIMAPILVPAKVCAVCSGVFEESASALLCRGCGFTIHPGCKSGARLCPKCSKPLIAAATAVGFETSRAEAKRAIEYRLAALLLAGGLGTASAVPALDFISGAWRGNWIGIPFGTWIIAAVGAFVTLTAVAFLSLRRSSAALTAMLLYSVVAILFIPGTNACLNALAGPGSPFNPDSAFVVSLIPLCLAPAAWWEFGRWKQIPGNSFAAGTSVSSSARQGLAGVMEALQSPLPFGAGLWVPLRDRKKKPDGKSS